MPYKSAKQRRYMHAQHPQIARRWDEKYGGKVQKVDAGNGTAVGKRLGVQPVLARRVPAAGRNGKRLTTGAQANVRAIIGKAAPDTKGLGATVTAFRGSSLKPPMPKGTVVPNTLKPMGGMPKKTPGQAGGATLAKPNGGQRPTSFGKRRYDPEDERRHRQGALAAAAGMSGAGLTAQGGRQIVRDTRGRRDAKSVLKPMPPTRDNGKTRGAGGRMRNMTPDEVARAEQAYGEARHLYDRQNKAFRSLNTKGAIVRGRSAAMVGGGLALLGAGGALHRNRREPRWD